jgi:hypothetical protein
LTFYADPGDERECELNTWNDGRGFHFSGPNDGHNIELLSAPRNTRRRQQRRARWGSSTPTCSFARTGLSAPTRAVESERIAETRPWPVNSRLLCDDLSAR